MKSAVRWVVLLVVVGLVAVPAGAAELRVTGYTDAAFPHFRSNVSEGDGDFASNKDQTTMGRTRTRLFFNIIGNDNVRAVYGTEINGIWGACNDEPQCYDRNTDTVNLRTKWAYIDFRMPQVPIGNRTRLGAMPLSVTPLHGGLLIHGDSAGGDTLLTFSDQVAMHLYYTQFTEDSEPAEDRYPGSSKLGDNFATGGTLRLRPIEGLDLHLPFVYGYLSGAFTGMTGNSGAYKNIVRSTQNIANESRYYLGFDSRWRIGNTSIEPTFLYLVGTRNFTTASRAITGVGKTDVNAYVGNLQVAHTWGSWLFQGRVAYASGNEANDDINNTGVGNRADAKFWAPMNQDGGPFWQDWFEYFGTAEVDGTSIDTFRRMSESGGLDRFGWKSIAGAVEYQLRDNLILEGAAGGFWSVEKTGCPSNARSAGIDSPCLVSIPGPSASAPNWRNQSRFEFTGNSRFLGWEVAGGTRYTILPGLTWMTRLSYASLGEALNQNNRSALDGFIFSNRMIFTF